MNSFEFNSKASQRLCTTYELMADVVSCVGSKIAHTNKTIARVNVSHYMINIYHMIKASVPLMTFTANLSNTPACLKHYCDSHSIEELYHDEWLLRDLVNIGFDKDDITSQPVAEEVLALVGSQYYLAAHISPASLLGYLVRLEYGHITEQQINNMVQATGFPLSCFNTLTEHAELDEGHSADLWSVIDEVVSMDSSIVGVIRHNMIRSTNLFADVLNLSSATESRPIAVRNLFDA